MKKILLLALAFALAAPACMAQSIDSSISVKQFPGATVGAKVSAAMATCPQAPIPCILVLDPSLAAAAAGTLPTLCGTCILADYRSGIPSGGYPGVNSDGSGGLVMNRLDAAFIVNGAFPVYYSSQFLGPAGGDHCMAQYLASSFALAGSNGSNVQGPWASQPTYTVGERVYYTDGNIYQAKSTVPTNTVPTNATYWTPLGTIRTGFIVVDDGVPAAGTSWNCSISPTYALTPQGAASWFPVNAIFMEAPGATYVMNIATTVTIPSHVWLQGQSQEIDSGTGAILGGTVFQMGNSFPANTPMFSAIMPFGMAGGGSNGSGFGSRVMNMGVNCETPSGSVISGSLAYYNGAGQEYTGFDRLDVFNCQIGADIEYASGITNGSQYSGPYDGLKYHGNGNFGGSTAVCGEFGVNTTGAYAKQANNWSCIGEGLGTEGTAAVVIAAGLVNLKGLSCENWQYCVEMGTVHNGTYGNINVDGVTALVSGGQPITSTVYVQNGLSGSGVLNLNLLNIECGGQFALVDKLPGGATVPCYPGTGGNPYLQFYSRTGNKVISSSPFVPAVNNMVGVAVHNCTSTSVAYAPVQGLALTGGCAKATTSTTQVPFGIWASGQADAFAAHTANICILGTCYCDFGAVTVVNGDYVTPGASICTDAGTTLPTTPMLGSLLAGESAPAAGTVASVTVNGTAGSSTVVYVVVAQSTTDLSRSAASAAVQTTTSNSVLNGKNGNFNTVTLSASPAAGTVWAVCRSSSNASGNAATTGFIGYTSGTTLPDDGQLADGTACTTGGYTAAHVIAPVAVNVDPAP